MLLLAKLVDFVDALALLHDETICLDINPDEVLAFVQEDGLIWKSSNFGLAQKLGASKVTRKRASHSVPELFANLLSKYFFMRPAGTYSDLEIQERDISRVLFSSSVRSYFPQ